MKIIIEQSYQEMSKKAANDVLKMVDGLKKTPLLCTASGDSPAGLYEELTTRINADNKDITEWQFLGLDEWRNMNGDDEGSCRFHLDNQLFRPLKVKEDNIAFFDGRAKDPKAECERIEAFIKTHKGIDIAIVGLGMNGHIGMNEPGTSHFLRSHVSQLAEETIQTGQKYFKEATPLSQGLTLGIANLMEARQVILVVNGSKKASIVKQVLEGKISEELPASLMRNHKHFTVYLDAAAARYLQAE